MPTPAPTTAAPTAAPTRPPRTKGCSYYSNNQEACCATTKCGFSGSSCLQLANWPNDTPNACVPTPAPTPGLGTRQKADQGKGELDIEDNVGITFKLRCTAQLTLPQDLGGAKIFLSGQYKNEILSFEATADMKIFKTDAVLRFGASRHPDKKRNQMYILFELPKGLQMRNLPGFEKFQGIDKLPGLAPGTLITYSNMNGIVGEIGKDLLLDYADEVKTGLGVLIKEHIPQSEDEAPEVDSFTDTSSAEGAYPDYSPDVNGAQPYAFSDDNPLGAETSEIGDELVEFGICLLYTSPSPRDS